VALVVEVNDKGDSRASMGNQMAVLTRDGVTYLLMSDLSGLFAVRQDDWVAVQMQAMRAAIPQGMPSLGKLGEYEIVEGGSETVAGRTGTLWTVRPKARPAQSDVSTSSGFEFVVSPDPDLAAVGRALATQLGASSNMMGALMGSTPDFFAKIEAVLAKGTVIRMGRVLRLDSIGHDAIPPSQFAFPGPLLTREDYAARAGPRAAH
jgi:hypothetical protein